MWSKILFHEQERQYCLSNLFGCVCPRRFKFKTKSSGTPKPEAKKTDELENIDDAPDDSSDDDIISLDDQKEIEESDEEKKPD